MRHIADRVHFGRRDRNHLSGGRGLRKRVSAKTKVLGENDRVAAELRSRFAKRKTLVLNLISAPGAGKTSLLEESLERFPSELRTAVLTGDIETDNDAARIARSGTPVKQITTRGSCHLNAQMVGRGLEKLGARDIDILFIENVGNLVCPASFDLGETSKIVVLSVTEGDDKPLKYPATFVKSRLVVINKIDLLPYVEFDLARAHENAKRVHPDIDILETSCKTGDGIETWIRWVVERLKAVRS
ncbi:MAG: hydrogenase nickel incorporation protein HypB [Candidatus Latescibacterota bacterium]|nr:MAG: hydrogenase nickel incorporation protein HypB [Candidatus Latescibacterota bacterium]